MALTWERYIIQSWQIRVYGVKPSDYKNSTPLMYLDGVALEYVDRVKYLGVPLIQDMKDDADMNRHLRSFYAYIHILM